MSSSIFGGTPKDYKIEIYNSEKKQTEIVDVNKLNEAQRSKIEAHFKVIEDEARGLTNGAETDELKITNLRVTDQTSNKTVLNNNKIQENLRDIAKAIKPDESTHIHLSAVIIKVNAVQTQNIQNQQIQSSLSSGSLEKETISSLTTKNTVLSLLGKFLGGIKKLQLFTINLFEPKVKPRYAHSPLSIKIKTLEEDISKTDLHIDNYKLLIKKIPQEIDRITKKTLSSSLTTQETVELQNYALELHQMEKKITGELKQLTIEKQVMREKLIQLKSIQADIRSGQWIHHDINDPDLTAELIYEDEFKKGREPETINRQKSVKEALLFVPSNTVSLENTSETKSLNQIKSKLLEIFTTEINFYKKIVLLTDILDNKNFIKYTEELGISKVRFEIFFRQAESIKEASELFLINMHEVNKLVESGDLNSALQLYYEFIDKNYTNYSKSFKDWGIFNALANKLSKNFVNEFDSLLKRSYDKSNLSLASVNDTSMFSLLIQPIQRGPRIELLTNEINKEVVNLSNNNPQFKELHLKNSETALQTIKDNQNQINDNLRNFESFTNTDSLSKLLKNNALWSDKNWLATLKSYGINRSSFQNLEKLYVQSGKDIEELMKINFALELNPYDELLREEAKSLSLKVLTSIQDFRKEYQKLGGQAFLNRLNLALGDYIDKLEPNTLYAKDVKTTQESIEFMIQRTYYFDKFYELNAKELGINIK